MKRLIYIFIVIIQMAAIITRSRVVKKAHDKQLDLIALTDHNTIDGIDEFKQACIKYRQNALAGIEVSTNYQGQEIHLLGYFNLENDSFESLSKLISAYQNIKITQNEAILNKLKNSFPMYQ